ncbi:MAG: Wzz/FepE/Etk N-terminal domain-containing protein, partial [Candidatus Binatia bacterium]
MNDLTYSSPPSQSEVAPYPQPTAREQAYYAQQNEEPHLRDYLNVLLKRARSMMMVFCAVMALGLLYTCSSPTLYTAKSVLKIEPQNPAVTGIAEMIPSQSQMTEGAYGYYETQFSMLKSSPLAARVVNKLRLEDKLSTDDRTMIGALLDIVLTPLDWFQSGIDWLLRSSPGTGASRP